MKLHIKSNFGKRRIRLREHSCYIHTAIGEGLYWNIFYIFTESHNSPKFISMHFINFMFIRTVQFDIVDSVRDYLIN